MYNRSKTVGASDAVMIQSGEWAQLYDRKTSPDAPDSSETNDRLAFEIGHALEPLNRLVFTRTSGIDVLHDDLDEDKPFTLNGYDWCTYLPDGLCKNNDHSHIPFEAKAVNMMWNPVNLLNKYMPQLQHAMRVMQAPYCYFSVIYLNTRYEYTQVHYDPPYDDALFEKEQLFYFMLERGIRPPEYQGKRAGWTA